MNAAEPSSAVLQAAEALIGFDTTSRHSNLGLIEWARDRLRALGADCRLSWDADRRKANLFATLGPAVDGGLVLSGHTDVVPVDGQDWHSDPFRAVVREGRLHGRGACDMKGFIACALAVAPLALAAGAGRPLHLALSYDEEVGCIGVRGLLAELAEAGIAPAACLVGEPTGMQLVTGHKGRRAVRCCITGREAHSSRTDLGVNAIEYGGRLVAEAQRIARTLAREGPPPDGDDLPFSTLQCGTIRGGLTTNTVPRDCELGFELRYLPGPDALRPLDELQHHARTVLLPEMSVHHAEAGIAWTVLDDTPGLAIDATHPWVRQVAALLGAGRPRRVAYSTEAGLFQRAGIPTVLCGPGHIAQAHRPDEYVALAQLAACERFLQALVGARG